MRRIFIYLFCGSFIFPATLFSQPDLQLKKAFKEPPIESYPKTYWWWLNGHVDTVRIREEIEAMHQAGVSGFDIFDIGVPSSDTVVKAGAPFLGEESLQAIKLALELAKDRGMTAGLSMASSWNAGGSWITPQHAAKSIYFSKTSWSGTKVRLNFPEIDTVDGRGRKKRISFDEWGRPQYYEEICVLAIPVRGGDAGYAPEQIINVSKYFDPQAEELRWNKKGEYEIYRYICSNSGEELKLPSKLSAGPIIDHFDAEATAAHFEYVLDKLRSILPHGIEHSALKSLYLASYEATGFTWTPTLPEIFKKINGYEIYPFIPALFNKDIFEEETYLEFQRDFRRTLSELMIDNFYRVARKICHENGLKINSESGGPGFPLHNVPVEPLKSLGVMDLPRGEFWINHNRLNAEGIDILRVVKEVSSASHIYGRGVVEEEAFTTFQHWQEGPFEMKPAGDRAFCEGMNKVVVHGSSHNPRGYGLPGIYYGAGTHYNDRRIWWPMVKPFNDYLARISCVAQQGQFFADVLYYYGDAIPNYAGHKNSRFMVGPGYDYEVINTEILEQLTVADGQLILPTGAKFKMLVLEPEKMMHPAVFNKLKMLANAGAIIFGDKPQEILTRKNLPELEFSSADIDLLWQDAAGVEHLDLKAGKVWSGIEPLDFLQHTGILPDLTYRDADFFYIDYIHYQKDAEDFYLIRNTTDQTINRRCRFRQNAKYVEIWDPLTGNIESDFLGSDVKGAYEMPVSLPPYSSIIVVFSEGKKETAVISFPDDTDIPDFSIYNDQLLIWKNGSYPIVSRGKEMEVDNPVKEQQLDGAWLVNFPSGWGTPEEVIFPELISWTDAEAEGVKYFSGVATYHKTFQVDIHSSVLPGQLIFLDLGDLTNVAEVWLNGQSLGVCWAKPYRLDVTNVIRAGDNQLEIKVANTWNNRLKGDAVTGAKFTNTNITNTNVAGLNKIRLKWSEVPLIKAGLFGPVKLVTLKPLHKS